MDIFRRNFNKLAVVTIFTALFIAGISTFQDYGISVDEKFQRSNGFYWLNYLLNFTNLEDLKTQVFLKLSTMQDFTLSDVKKYNFYGILFDLPAAFIETILDIKNSSDIYNLRHLLNFLLFYWINFFYKILNRRSNIQVFLGLYFLISPRIYGESFIIQRYYFLKFPLHSFILFF